MTELLLLVFGGIIFTVSFFLPAGRKKDNGALDGVGGEQIKEMINKEVAEAKSQINEIVDETITYTMEKTERSMERLTNEKMMAVNEFSDTVLEQINKNHQEAVFLYDMLNDKHENLKATVSEAAKTASEVKQRVKDVEITVKEAEEKRKEEEAAASAGEFVPIQPERVEIVFPAQALQEDMAKSGEEAPGTDPSSDQAAQEEAKTARRNNNDKILELHRLGMSEVAIAKELGLGVGEVMLVIGLFEGA